MESNNNNKKKKKNELAAAGEDELVQRITAAVGRQFTMKERDTRQRRGKVSSFELFVCVRSTAVLRNGTKKGTGGAVVVWDAGML
jgi:hypothetical protein